LLPLYLFNAPATTSIYTLSLHDALPIFLPDAQIDSTFAAIRAADPKKPIVSKVMGTFDGHSLMLIERKANGAVEVHQHKHDMLRSEEHTSELQSPYDLVCRLLLEKKKKK